MAVTLLDHQKTAVERLSNGKILWGGVGSGKSIAALAYYMDRELIGDIFVITTAKKRNTLEWERDASKFGIGTEREGTIAGTIKIDSWNNIAKYSDVQGAFFIFDEQRLVGNGTWVKSFYKIAKNNAWLILSATPGDTWMDYIPVFVANGFYRNITDFKNQHVVYEPFSKYPRIKTYLNVPKLERLKREVLVEMPYMSGSTRHHMDIRTFYDVEQYKRIAEDRWNIYEDRPIRDVSELFAIMRRFVYSDPSRLDQIRGLMDRHPKLIVFYNFNYELDILRELNDSFSDLVTVAEYNGHKKNPIPDTDHWVYLVQYRAGAEGWNCTETNAMAFYSLTYSYKQYEQAQGRIDRLTNIYKDLYYYNLISTSIPDRAVLASLKKKEDFNERKWAYENIPDMG